MSNDETQIKCGPRSLARDVALVSNHKADKPENLGTKRLSARKLAKWPRFQNPVLRLYS